MGIVLGVIIGAFGIGTSSAGAALAAFIWTWLGITLVYTAEITAGVAVAGGVIAGGVAGGVAIAGKHDPGESVVIGANANGSAALVDGSYVGTLITAALPTAGAGALRRGEPALTVNPFAPSIAAKFDNGRLYARQLKDQRMEMKWWDLATGEAQICWKDHPDHCGSIYNLFLFCWDWRFSNVPDDIPRRGYQGMEAWTPNGTLSMRMPFGDGPFLGYAS